MLSTPFNEQTFSGWAAVFGVNLIFASTYGVVYISTGSFFMANGLYFRACAQHFRSFLTDLGESLTIEQKLKMKSSLIEAINFHHTTKR